MKLTQAHLEEISRAIAANRKSEVCAFLLSGRDEESQLVVARNWSSNPQGFLIAYSERRRVERYADSVGMEVAALVHSHSTSTQLSEFDRGMLKESDLPWIVVASTDGIVSQRTYNEGGFQVGR
jgi:proteasome lid subunit RPN8/RPN11